MMDALPACMFLALIVLLFSGIPVGLVLAGVGIAFAVLGQWFGVLQAEQMFSLVIKRLFDNTVETQLLIAVPLFVLMGMILERAGLVEDLLRTCERLMGRLRGGLALAVIGVGALLAASTGIVGATVVTMTVMALPVMLRSGYHKGLACGTIAASGTLGQIIPPSIVLILLADQMQASAGDFFQGAMLPGVILVLLYAAYVVIRGWWRPADAPVSEDPEIAQPVTVAEVARTLAPPLVLILVVLGSILAGVATPTEASGLGAVGAAILAAVKGRFRFSEVWSGAQQTARITAMVLFILAGAQFFGLVFQSLHGDHMVARLLAGWNVGQAEFIILVMILVFVLGFFLDFLEICFIVIPLVMPIFDQLEIAAPEDKVFIGVLLALNLQTSFLTPPFGFSLFYLKGSAPPSITTGDIYRGILPFVVIQIAVIALVWFNPQLVWWLSAR